MSAADAPYRSPRPAGRDGFLQLLHAEWTKFRTVRGWVVGTVVGALVIILMAWLTSSLSHSEVCVATNGGPPTCHTAHPSTPTGPNGEPVTDQYYLVHQPLLRNGSITVRVTSLTGRIPRPRQRCTVGGNPQAGTGQGRAAVVEGRRDRQRRHRPGRGVRRGHGHRQPRRAHAVRLHPRRGRHAGDGLGRIRRAGCA